MERQAEYRAQELIHKRGFHHREDGEQEAVFDWAARMEIRWPELALLFAIPNGGARPIATAVRLKLTGVKAGVPDMQLPVARCGYHGLWIEMKVGTNTTSDKQEKWLTALVRAGHYVEVCYSADEAIKTITDYLTGAIQ